MSKGKRYSGEEKLNYKKVFAAVIAIIVIIIIENAKWDGELVTLWIKVNPMSVILSKNKK